MPKNLESDHYDRELNGSYSVAERLLPRHHQIMDLHMQSLSYQKIADTLGMSMRQVANVCNTPAFQNALALRRDKIEDAVEEDIIRQNDSVLEVLKQNTLNAVNRLTELMDDDNSSVARQAANDILDRGGYPKVQRQETKNESTLIVDSEQAKLLETALKEIE